MPSLRRETTGPRRGGNSARDLGFRVDADDLLRLQRDLKNIDKKLVGELQRGMRKAAKPVLVKAKANAAEWSRRIPKAIGLKTKFNSRRVGVFIEVDRKKAPHGRPFEYGSAKNGKWLRHPVFADINKDRVDWTWRKERTRPFFFKAAEGERANIEREVAEVMDRVALKAGFKRGSGL